MKRPAKKAPYLGLGPPRQSPYDTLKKEGREGTGEGEDGLSFGKRALPLRQKRDEIQI